MDEREHSHWKTDVKNASYSSLSSAMRAMMPNATFVVVVKDTSYKILKDRIYGQTNGEYPLDELPDLIKRRLVHTLKARDGVCTE